MLGRRGKDTEHSAMRKLKNEFMASWDGLRTRERERVLVLAATNRPFDLDEDVIRRFPRRYSFLSVSTEMWLISSEVGAGQMVLSRVRWVEFLLPARCRLSRPCM